MSDQIHVGAEPAGEAVFVPMSEPISVAQQAGADVTQNFFSALPDDGCYQITLTPPGTSGMEFRGTMRVDSASGQLAISIDLYSIATTVRRPLAGVIPVYPRANYHSYLKVVGITQVPNPTLGVPTILNLSAEEYFFNPPGPGSFNGSFPPSPSRIVTIGLVSVALPPGQKFRAFMGGFMSSGNQTLGSLSTVFASTLYRSALLIVHTLEGAAPPPMAVPGGTAGTTEDFSSVFATAGWRFLAIPDTDTLPVPPGVNPNACWSDADLFNLLATALARSSEVDLEWRYHLLIVPGTMNCGRGSVFDTAGSTAGGFAPRQASVSYSDDGYPSTDSSNFGAAANQKQRDVPRAFLRSACHEVGHGFNQQHQELTDLGEPGADNSIMTTSPSVADVLAAQGGVFPDGINLGFNAHVRHHMIHFPDPVVRPGGMTFEQGHITTVPQADRDRTSLHPADLELKLTPAATRVKLGQPLRLDWQLVNRGQGSVRVPSDIGPRSLHARVMIYNPPHPPRRVSPMVIRTDAVSLRNLPPQGTLEGHTTLFWSSRGFAFPTPGKHWLTVRIVWNDGGTAYAVAADTEVWVDYPANEADNAVATKMMHREVGMIVALGGASPKLEAGTAQISEASSAYPDHPACQHMATLTGQGSGDAGRKRSKPK
jgi:hypothetical protein